MASLRDNDVRIPLARLDELEVHRLYRLAVALNDLLHGFASLDYVPCHHPHQPVVIIRIHEDLDVHLLSEFLAGKDQDALDDDYLGRVDSDGLGSRPGAGQIGINRLFNPVSLLQFPELLAEEPEVD